MRLIELKIGMTLLGMFGKMVYVKNITNKYVECIRIDFSSTIAISTFRLPLREWNPKMMNYKLSSNTVLIKYVFDH